MTRKMKTFRRGEQTKLQYKSEQLRVTENTVHFAHLKSAHSVTKDKVSRVLCAHDRKNRGSATERKRRECALKATAKWNELCERVWQENHWNTWKKCAHYIYCACVFHEIVSGVCFFLLAVTRFICSVSRLAREMFAQKQPIKLETKALV